MLLPDLPIEVLFNDFLSYFSVKTPKDEAPRFISPLQSRVEIEERDSVKLSCKISGTPNPTLEWFINGRSVRPSPRLFTSFDGKYARFTLSNATPEDLGLYKVVATNSAGTSSSSSDVVVRRGTKRPQILEKLKDIEASEASEITFETKISGSPKVEWFSGSTEIYEGGRFRIIEDTERQRYGLVIRDLRRNDEGSYKCVASNDAGKSTTRAELYVTEKEYAPVFDDKDKTLVIPENRELNVGFKIRGLPKPNVVWYKNGIELEESNKVDFRSRGDTYSVVIYKVSSGDTGKYKCEASNRHGTSSCYLDLSVEGWSNFLYTFVFFYEIDATFHDNAIFSELGMGERHKGCGFSTDRPTFSTLLY